MNFFSASLACTKTTSAPPRRANSGLGLEQRQDVAEQPGILRRSGRGNHDGFILRRSERYLRKGKGNHKREISHSGGALIEWSSWNIQSWSEPLPFFIQPLGSLFLLVNGLLPFQAS